MTLRASVLCFKGEFVAELSDGRKMVQPDLNTMAVALFRVGVPSCNVDYAWRSGTCMITAGQQVALSAQVSRLEREFQPEMKAATAA